MTLKTRITIAAVTAILVVAATLLIIGQQIENSIEDRLQNLSITSKKNLWEKIISTEINLMRANTSSIARDRDTLKALKNRNIALLAENASTTYNMLSAEGVVTKIQIADLQGEILYSAPDNFKGKTKKSLPTDAASSGKIMSGIEHDDDGKLYANLAFPVYVRGKAVGVVVYMRDLQSAIEDLKLNDKSDTFIISAQGITEYATDADLIEQIELTLPQAGDHATEMIKLNDQILSITIQPLLNVNAQAVAHLVSAKDETSNYQNQQNLVLFSYLSIFIVILASVIGLTLFLFKSFKPLDTSVKIMKKIAQGDFTHHIETEKINNKDEIGQLIIAMSAITENIGHIVSNVYKAADNIDQASQLVSNDINDLSHRTIAHASSLEETAASMEQMTGTVSQNTHSAERANQLADAALDDAIKGGQVVELSIQSMNEINNSSSKIVDIIATINAIAFQTNLLALNAAVEAARAGEQGRGFAVVANEVRTLALRCADAAKEIKVLIEASVERIKAGSELADQSGQNLSDIVNGIKMVANTVSEIDKASVEQAAGINGINNEIIEMDKMTQQNTLMIEKSASASQSMKDEVKHLTELMEFFSLPEKTNTTGVKSQRDLSLEKIE